MLYIEIEMKSVYKKHLAEQYGWTHTTMWRRIKELEGEFLKIDIPGYRYERYAKIFKAPELEIIYKVYGQPDNIR